MAIYNIDNIRSINEAGAHKKFMKKAEEAYYTHNPKGKMYMDLADRYEKNNNPDRASKMRTKAIGHYAKAIFENTPEQHLGSTNHVSIRRTYKGIRYNDLTDGQKRNIADNNRYIKNALRDNGEDYIGNRKPNYYLNVAKASKAKLKEAAQYILDVLDEND